MRGVEYQPDEPLEPLDEGGSRGTVYQPELPPEPLVEGGSGGTVYQPFSGDVWVGGRVGSEARGSYHPGAGTVFAPSHSGHVRMPFSQNPHTK